LLNAIDGCYSIALDGKWGSGKTFFVKQAIFALNANNDAISNIDETDKKKIMDLWKTSKRNRKTELNPFVSVYYNAWANDNDIDPVLSIIYEIILCVESDYSFKKGSGFRSIAAGIAEMLTGRSAVTLLNALQGEDPLCKIKSNKYLQETINNFLESLLVERGNRLIIFIDELDRCKPSYAVKVLERIKHYFPNENITFVFSVNIDELQHTIKRFYGEGFDGNKYLDRFFDMRISLPPVNKHLFYRRLGLDYDRFTFEKICKAIIEFYHFDLRESSRFYQQAKMAVHQSVFENRDFSFPEEKALQFCLICIVPLMIGLKMHNLSKYNSFILGYDSSPLHEVFNGKNADHFIFKSLLSGAERFGNLKVGDEPVVYLKDRLEMVYTALFIQEYSGAIYEKTIGNASFTEETQKKLFEIVNLWSNFADFDI